MKQTFGVVLEEGTASWGAHAPDFAGLYAVGNTKEEARRMLALGLKEHIRVLVADGLQVPKPSCRLGLVTTDQQESWPNGPSMRIEIIDRG